ncbi:hypothetical protein [Indiicoccus explosivorum]|uniref:hypothetical protein n=1 Tax=Indiicoccus explosivorum TaxID=1917864 RepID=UPI000B439585|nr:hypothetical protein [Indiicoccus explosivorum]
MKHIGTLAGTLAVLSLINWGLTLLFPVNYVDIGIPLAVLAVFIAHSFGNSGGGIGTRQVDMEVRGETGIQMKLENQTSERSFIFFGTLVYLLGILLLAVAIYWEYFFS